MASNYLISRLLSGRNQLSRVEADELRETILGEVAPRARARRWRFGPPALALAGAAAALLLVIPLALRSPTSEGGGAPAEFTPRGHAQAVADLELVCASTKAATCRPGETLLFDVSGASGYAYVAAFAQREDGAVIWYFPESPGADARALDEVHGGLLGRGIAIGDDHPPGRYRVFAVLSEQPLGRDDIIARFDEAGPSAGPGTAVVERELVVE